MIPALVAALLFVLSACSDDKSTTADPGSNSPVGDTDDADDDQAGIDITDALFTNLEGSCSAYVNSYVSNVMDLQRGTAFAGALSITASAGKCVFATNAIPNHDFNDGGSFAHAVSTQNVRYEVTATPAFAAEASPLVLGDDAIFLNGVKLDLLAAACYDVGPEPEGQEKIGCGPDQIDNPWRYDPMSPLNDFGTDRNNAHTPPDGSYHYHGDPMAMFSGDCAAATGPSPVIGFAADGFPIHGSCTDDNGLIRTVASSFVLREDGGTRRDIDGYTTPVNGRGTIDSPNYDGQFRGDYEYQPGAGDLDECNGMEVDGQYGYYVTSAYPWVVGCFKGEPDPSFYRLGP
jgi:hypothetical protein